MCNYGLWDSASCFGVANPESRHDSPNDKGIKFSLCLNKHDAMKMDVD